MTDLPQWAMEKAIELVLDMYTDWSGDGKLSDEMADYERNEAILSIARALVEAEARGIEKAAELCEGHVEEVRRGNVRTLGDLPQGLNSHHSGQTYAAAIRKLKDKDNE